MFTEQHIKKHQHINININRTAQHTVARHSTPTQITSQHSTVQRGIAQTDGTMD
jgi:hypothetical protein